MKLPLSWLREFVAIPDGVTLPELEEAFVSVGFEVEEIEEQGVDLSGPVVVARVVSI